LIELTASARTPDIAVLDHPHSAALVNVMESAVEFPVRGDQFTSKPSATFMWFQRLLWRESAALNPPENGNNNAQNTTRLSLDKKVARSNDTLSSCALEIASVCSRS